MVPNDVLSAQFRAGLVGFGRRHLGDRAAAEDLAQETLRRVFEAMTAGRIRQAGALRPFAYQTARHVMQQAYRRAARERRALARLESDPVYADAARVPSPMDGLISDELHAQVRRGLGCLADGDRMLLLPSDGERDAHSKPLPVPRAVSSGALRVRKHRALKRLAGLLE